MSLLQLKLSVAAGFTSKRVGQALTCVVTSLLLANCSSGGRQVASSSSSEIGAFPQKKYGAASPRVVADGEAVPKGGGRYQVGKSYSIAGRTYVPREMNGNYSAVGQASWYGDAFHGRKTANGEIYDKNSITAAHPTMPLPSYARVTNLLNGRSIIVRVNDRGPYHGGRVMDVSQRVAEALEFKHLGTARVKVEHMAPAGLAGSDDRKLIASLSTGGQPATLPGIGPSTVQLASADPSFTPAPRIQAVLPVSRPQPVLASTSAQAVEPVTAEAETESDTPAPVLASASSQPTARAVPLPPERPYDFNSISAPVTQPVQKLVQPSTAAKQQAILPRIQGRIASAVSYYAPESEVRTQFAKNDPFAKLDQAANTKRFVAASGFETMLNVGVFRNSANAEKIIAGLGNEANAKLVKLALPSGDMFKVVAGPFAKPELANAAQAKAKALGATDARIIQR